jgi:hypothetical protein
VCVLSKRNIVEQGTNVLSAIKGCVLTPALWFTTLNHKFETNPILGKADHAIIPFSLCTDIFLMPNILLYKGHLQSMWNSPYYSKWELRGGAMIVSFLKYLPWQAMHFLQCFTHFLKTCCRPMITLKFLALELPFHGWKSPDIAYSKI